ncbi:MAG TPA: DinB family protein [Gemmatimonadaceae bacterium]
MPGCGTPTGIASSFTSSWSALQPEGQHLVDKESRNKTEGERIADEIGRAFSGDAWHGPSLNALLGGLSAREALQRPIPAAHTIWELVLHITSWSNIALRRITGGQAEPFEGEDWPLPDGKSEEHWAEACAAMADSHNRLREVVAVLSDEDLARNAPQSDRSVSAMLHGVTQHDAYHGGQIAILRKSVTPHQRRTAI